MIVIQYAGHKTSEGMGPKCTHKRSQSMLGSFDWKKSIDGGLDTKICHSKRLFCSVKQYMYALWLHLGYRQCNNDERGLGEAEGKTKLLDRKGFCLVGPSGGTQKRQIHERKRCYRKGVSV